MTTLKQFRREMLARVPGSALGRLETIASLTTTTAVVSALATGGDSADRFIGQYGVRAETANSADRVRRWTNFATASGTFTHAGTNYADTTATSEFLEILQHEPYLYDAAIQMTLGRLLRQDREIFPTVAGQSLYRLHDLTWIKDHGDIMRVAYSPNPVVTRDRYFESWNTINTSGTPQLDNWTLAGASATYARSTTSAHRSQYSVAVTRSGTNATLSQTPGLLINDTAASNGEDLRGQVFSVTGVGVSSVASQIRVQWNDGTQTVSSSYHTGGGAREELTASGTIASTATTLIVRWSIETDNTVCYLNQLYGYERSALDDGIRRGEYREEEMPRETWDQGDVNLGLRLPKRGRGGQYVVYSRRPYPKFDATRVAAGTADADESDAPVETVAVMAIGRLFEGLARQPGMDTTRYAMLAADWNHRGEKLALNHLAQPTHPKGGAFLPRPQFGLVPVRR